MILGGTHLGFRNLKNTWDTEDIKSEQLFLISLPMDIFILAISVSMIFFFTN